MVSGLFLQELPREKKCRGNGLVRNCIGGLNLPKNDCYWKLQLSETVF